MSGVKRYDCDPCHEHICRFEREESESGEYVLASDYVALEAERDELRVQVEAMMVDSGRKQALIDALVELSEVRMSREERQLRIDAALQATP